ncbi:MAG: HAMP domain-containing histidine kinase, partial [Lentisphaeria bacterium]|nr:HAMP domain-containing histidine kinase [Lentisphaeria bacterium]
MNDKRSWIIFLSCITLLLVVMLLVSRKMVRLDEQDLRLHEEADVSESTRVALWRMDSHAVNLINDAFLNPNSPYVKMRINKYGSYVLNRNRLLISKELLGQYYELHAQDTESVEDEQPYRHLMEYNARLSLSADNKCRWINGQLVIFRDVKSEVSVIVLDWEKVKLELATVANSLLKNVTFDKINGTPFSPATSMVSIPVSINAKETFRYERSSSPIRSMLVIAWSCIFLPAIGLAMIIFASSKLSERRASFVAAITHELRTPLTTFKLYTEMLRDGMVSEEKQKEYYEILHHEAGRLNHLVENVLAYSRIERGKSLDKEASAKIGDIWTAIATEIDMFIKRSEFDLDNQLDMDADVFVEKAGVERILINLIDNACKYGTGETNKICLKSEKDGDDVLIIVEDWGRGVDADILTKMFKEFRKSDSEAANSAAGVGLGLALSKRIAESMGGTISYK